MMTLFLLLADDPTVLFLTHSAGFRHSVVTRKGDDLSWAEQKLIAAAKGRFKVVATQDCSELKNLAKYDAVVLYTTGELPVDPNLLLDYVRGGGGFVGIHCATDTFYKVPEYQKMIGGVFDGHPWTRKVGVKVHATHAATAHLGASFEIDDEIYQFRDLQDMNVLLSLDKATAEGATDRPYPLAWTREFGRGRVFYSALGHREKIWEDERFLTMLLAGIEWTFQDAEGFTPLFDAGHGEGWSQAGPGRFILKDGVATAEGGMGLWYHEKSLTDFILKLEFRMPQVGSNSGVFVRFPDPGDDPWVAVKQGYEIQICGDQPGKNATGAIYDFKGAAEIPLKPAGEWNEYEIAVVGQDYTVVLNGKLINTFKGERTLKGMIGVQNHGAEIDGVSYRNIRVRELENAAAYLVDGMSEKDHTAMFEWKGADAFFEGIILPRADDWTRGEVSVVGKKGFLRVNGKPAGEFELVFKGRRGDIRNVRVVEHK